ncbi:hypothetical protein [Shouchella patagoniensis]|uniref:hypothetical protein n=1 Tax=Shouchella patagoniensis TaxID=228576 RepID=UPI0009954B43|nr:hypothetical protein [Shouchella patagoniensis]
MKRRMWLRLYVTRLKEIQKPIIFWSLSTVFTSAVFILAVLVAYQSSGYHERWNKVQNDQAYDFVLRDANEETTEYVQSRRDTTLAWLVGDQETWEQEEGTPITVQQLNNPHFIESGFYLHRGEWPSKGNEIALDFQFALETMPELLFGDKIRFVHDDVEQAFTVTGLYNGYGEMTEALVLGEPTLGDLYVVTSNEDVKQTKDAIEEQTGMRSRGNLHHVSIDWTPFYEQHDGLKTTVYVLVLVLFLFAGSSTYMFTREIKLAFRNDEDLLMRLGFSPRTYKKGMTVLGVALALLMTGLSTGLSILLYNFIGEDAVVAFGTLSESFNYLGIGSIHVLFPFTMIIIASIALLTMSFLIFTTVLASIKKMQRGLAFIKPVMVVGLTVVLLSLVQLIDLTNERMNEISEWQGKKEDFLYTQFYHDDQEEIVMEKLRTTNKSFLELRHIGFYQVKHTTGELNEDEQYMYWDTLTVMEASEDDWKTLWSLMSPAGVTSSDEFSNGGILLADIRAEGFSEEDWGMEQLLELGSQFQLAPSEEEVTFSDEIFEVEAVAEFQGSYPVQMIIVPENTFAAIQGEWSEIVLFSLDRDAAALKEEMEPFISNHPYIATYVPSQYGYGTFDEQKLEESKGIFVAFILAPFLLAAVFTQFSIGFAYPRLSIKYRSLLIFGTAVIASVAGWLGTTVMEGGPVPLSFLFALFTGLSLAGFSGLALYTFKRKKNEEVV